jgi:hypothetical protein
MKQEELRQEVLRLSDANDIPTNIEYLDYFIQCFFDLVVYHRQDKLKMEGEADAKIILQMMFSKLIHLKKLLGGVHFTNKKGQQLTDTIIDPTVVTSLVRTIYETVCLFNIVYAVPNTADKRKILYYLWVSSGLNYQQEFSPAYASEAKKKKVAEDKKKIASLKKAIEDTEQYKALDKYNQNKIQLELRDKDFKIKIENNTVRCLSWQKISKEFITKSDVFDKIYTYFSLHTHPSNVSVLQFANMFREEEDTFKRITVFNLRFCLALSSIFLSDFIRLFPATLSTFEKRSDIEQIMLNFFNRMLREDNKSISDVSERLG